MEAYDALDAAQKKRTRDKISHKPKLCVKAPAVRWMLVVGP
jgi:hypothetical protein